MVKPIKLKSFTRKSFITHLEVDSPVRKLRVQVLPKPTVLTFNEIQIDKSPIMKMNNEEVMKQDKVQNVSSLQKWLIEKQHVESFILQPMTKLYGHYDYDITHPLIIQASQLSNTKAKLIQDPPILSTFAVLLFLIIYPKIDNDDKQLKDVVKSKSHFIINILFKALCILAATFKVIDPGGNNSLTFSFIKWTNLSSHNSNTSRIVASTVAGIVTGMVYRMVAGMVAGK